MEVLQIDIADRRQVKQFLELPFYIYRGIPQWVPPLASDARRMLDQRRNPYYRHSEAAFFLAQDIHHNMVGRLAVLDNRRYNKFNQEKTAFFYLFECIDDREIACSLFEKAFGWAKQRGLNLISGPKGFTPLDGLGMLAKGFEHRPAFGLPYNPPYYINLIEAAGFIPAGDIVSGYMDRLTPFPTEKIMRASELIQKRRGLRVAHYRSRHDLRALIPHLHKLYNDSLEGTAGNYPLTDEEVKSLADQLLWFAEPGLIKIIMKDEQPVGFLFAYPDISAALQQTRGRLLPFGWIHFLIELKRTRWININGAGILEKFRGQGGTALLFGEMYKSVSESRYQFADLVQIGMDNGNMQRELRELGIEFYKTHRMYQRSLC